MFTMREYIEKHALGVHLRDARAVMTIADHLRRKGYVRKRRWWKGKPQYVWEKPVLRSDISDLAFKLSTLGEE